MRKEKTVEQDFVDARGRLDGVGGIKGETPAVALTSTWDMMEFIGKKAKRKKVPLPVDFSYFLRSLMALKKVHAIIKKRNGKRGGMCA